MSTIPGPEDTSEIRGRETRGKVEVCTAEARSRISNHDTLASGGHQCLYFAWTVLSRHHTGQSLADPLDRVKLERARARMLLGLRDSRHHFLGRGACRGYTIAQLAHTNHLNVSVVVHHLKHVGPSPAASIRCYTQRPGGDLTPGLHLTNGEILPQNLMGLPMHIR
ncbi:hypothetical protein VOLCADRAFT_97551 [Volvox carteri f. nagariensis]|uniref:Uncharacterized protein n=1 Tax=Volvox carteri f. nagariensis TaxID=3068 RepID=D8UD12_VOLCA|nr:uncharacterized protein VOLCADRAFT_97551 [Volvox carteri f. nagariensis]EFJ42350.1 hypothetical protein VOLCADRAFT_97551 [Volvox carteri f. nagariensis]|eukprot:XP_002956583.1 hypothetical protein VOLCADRAFT_97551 [Volvox carteri f. nagariensis]